MSQVICGDSAEVLKTFDADCTDLTVTSPPYDKLRSNAEYKAEFDFETIASELYRVTKPGGVVVWVVGDATVNGSETGTSFRQALYFMECGFNLHDTMIYEKVSGASGSNKSYWQSFEYMFVFSKGTPKTINLICDRKNTSSPIGLQKKAGGHRKDNGDKKPIRMINRQEFGRRMNIWRYHTADITEFTEHPAQFPESLARDHILSWSNPGDLVLDCFAGSGTTLKMAKELSREYIGIERSQKYVDEIILPRLAATSVPLPLMTAQPRPVESQAGLL